MTAVSTACEVCRFWGLKWEMLPPSSQSMSMGRGPGKAWLEAFVLILSMCMRCQETPEGLDNTSITFWVRTVLVSAGEGRKVVLAAASAKGISVDLESIAIVCTAVSATSLTVGVSSVVTLYWSLSRLFPWLFSWCWFNAWNWLNMFPQELWGQRKIWSAWLATCLSRFVLDLNCRPQVGQWKTARLSFFRGSAFAATVGWSVLSWLSAVRFAGSFLDEYEHVLALDLGVALPERLAFCSLFQCVPCEILSDSRWLSAAVFFVFLTVSPQERFRARSHAHWTRVCALLLWHQTWTRMVPDTCRPCHCDAPRGILVVPPPEMCVHRIDKPATTPAFVVQAAPSVSAWQFFWFWLLFLPLTWHCAWQLSCFSSALHLMRDPPWRKQRNTFVNSAKFKAKQSEHPKQEWMVSDRNDQNKLCVWRPKLLKIAPAARKTNCWGRVTFEKKNHKDNGNVVPVSLILLKTAREHAVSRKQTNGSQPQAYLELDSAGSELAWLSSSHKLTFSSRSGSRSTEAFFAGDALDWRLGSSSSSVKKASCASSSILLLFICAIVEFWVFCSEKGKAQYQRLYLKSLFQDRRHFEPGTSYSKGKQSTDERGWLHSGEIH